jgi:hypothetical protein
MSEFATVQFYAYNVVATPVTISTCIIRIHDPIKEHLCTVVMSKEVTPISSSK